MGPGVEVRLRLLGSAAGGAYPQWNCACACCRLAREDSTRAWPRTRCSLAFSGSGDEWYLIGAGPDVRPQVEGFPALHPGPGPRDTRTNPVLDERSPERGQLRALGIEVGWDGMEVEL